MKIVDMFINRLWIDWVVLTVIAGIFLKWGVVQILPSSDLASLYQTVISIAIGMLGLGSVTVTLIVTGTSNEKLRSVIASDGRSLFSLIFGCLFGYLICAVAVLALYFGGTASASAIENAVFVCASALLILRSTRLIWLLRLILNLLI